MLRCISCKKISLSLICTDCQSTYLKPSFYTRVLANGFKVYSFYKYSDISIYITTKHKFIGYFVYRIMAKNSFKKFAENFNFDEQVYSIAIDDKVDSGYSHTAILSNALRSDKIKPLQKGLRANNDINYSGKSLEYRLTHSRDFRSTLSGKKDLILVDDIITTGTTILEAKKVLEKSDQSPLFALCLADARDM